MTERCATPAAFTGHMSGVVATCALPAGHDGPHQTSYGKPFTTTSPTRWDEDMEAGAIGGF